MISISVESHSQLGHSVTLLVFVPLAIAVMDSINLTTMVKAKTLEACHMGPTGVEFQVKSDG